MEKELTLEDLKKTLPTRLHTALGQELLDKINIINSDVPHAAENIRDNFITYIDVLSEGKYKIDDYINAIKYVSYKLMGKTNRDAYKFTFPDRFWTMKEKEILDKDIDSIISAYNRNKLVNAIYEKTIIPSWILNQDAYQEAINTQVKLMRTANSERVRAMAADSILNHLKRPENLGQAQLNINVNTTSALDELQKNMLELVKTQRDLIKAGVGTKEIAEQRIFIDVQTEDTGTVAE